ncbi:hypothetical protein QN277_025083 [Acacia crassicarpa]|uniref:Uncharacterized protein n=1 Tax=Acacia crassicarpa TaxID=499986 RepID=A0AAE1MPR5_9FABA|nr:hypothetical protein QN277_025083 [Acacia crassicarpa]
MHMLPYKEAAKFSVLSKSLNPYWLSFPTLKFNYNSYNLPEDVSYDTFFNFVQKTLQLRGPYLKGCLQNLSLSYNSKDSNPHHYPKVLDVLLNFAFQNNVKEINFDIKERVKIIANVTYDSLRPLFSSQFLTVLKLGGVNIPLVDNVFITCPKLTELQFQNCHAFGTIHVSSSSLKQVKVIKCCSMMALKAFHILEGKSLHSFKLEGFTIDDPFDIKLPTSDFLIHDLHLTNVELSENIYDMVVARVELLFIDTCGMPKSMILHSPHIKVLEMKRNYKLENLVLRTPNLERFISVASLETLHCTLDISDCAALKVLKLDGTMSITGEWLKRTIWRLRSLKKLVIRNCDRLESVEFESDSLEKFSLYECFHLRKVDVHVLNLLEFYYSGSLQVYPMIILSCKCNGNIKLPYGRSNLDLMKQFLSFFDHFKDLTLSCSKAEDMIIPRQLNEKISPLYDLRHVKLQIRERFLPNGPILTQLLESLLWFVPRPDTITLSSNMTGSTRSTLKFKYGNPVESNDSVVGDCCRDTDDIRCWRHYEVKIEFEGFDESVREYLEEFFATSHRYYGIH